MIRDDNMWLSEHFRIPEFWCSCCGMHIENHRLIFALEALRKRCGCVPITILSGTRCKEWNTLVGGATGSKHLYGAAADIVIHGLHPIEMASKAEFISAFAHGGIGTYPNKGFIHVDVRLDSPARWTVND